MKIKKDNNRIKNRGIYFDIEQRERQKNRKKGQLLTKKGSRIEKKKAKLVKEVQ